MKSIVFIQSKILLEKNLLMNILNQDLINLNQWMNLFHT